MKKILGILTLVWAIMLSIIPTMCADIPASKLYEQKVNSILYLETQDSTGSGIILKDDGTFVTCFHVIANADYINAIAKDGTKYKVNGYKYINIKEDVAILTLATNKQFTPISLNNTPKIGDSVYTIANPKGLQFVFSNGMINQLTDKKIQYSAPSSPGSSGGALLNQSGELIGMIASQYNLTEAQNINFAIKNEFFTPFLDKKKKVNTKKLNWTDFVVSTLNKTELEQFRKFANKSKDFSMLYKYLRNATVLDTVSSHDYAYYGGIALVGYLDGAMDSSTLKEAMKWFALSICCNKNIELSSYGLVMSAIFNCSEKEDIYLYTDYLKKYPKTNKFLYTQFLDFLTCKENDKKGMNKCIDNMKSYLKYLLTETYLKD